MKKRVLLIFILLAAIFIVVLMLRSSEENQRSDMFISYWQRQGLSLEDAKYLSSQGRARIEEPATMAAFGEKVIAPEQIAGDVFQALIDEDGQRKKSSWQSSLSDLPGETAATVDLCTEDCRFGDWVPEKVVATANSVFWETNISAVTITQYCTEPGRAVGRPLFSEFYFLRDRWIPRYILLPLKESGFPISKDGKEDLREAQAQFQKLCRG